MQVTAMKVDANDGPLLLPATLDLAAAEGFPRSWSASA